MSTSLGQVASQMIPQIDGLAAVVGPTKEWINGVTDGLSKFFALKVTEKDRILRKQESINWMLTCFGEKSRELAHAA